VRHLQLVGLQLAGENGIALLTGEKIVVDGKIVR
jgi:hypothetical protein